MGGGRWQTWKTDLPTEEGTHLCRCCRGRESRRRWGACQREGSQPRARGTAPVTQPTAREADSEQHHDTVASAAKVRGRPPGQVGATGTEFTQAMEDSATTLGKQCGRFPCHPCHPAAQPWCLPESKGRTGHQQTVTQTSLAEALQGPSAGPANALAACEPEGKA